MASKGTPDSQFGRSPKLRTGRRSRTAITLPPMATDKRERQRANRAERQAEEAAALRKQKLIRRARQVATWAVIIVLFFVLANAVWGGA